MRVREAKAEDRAAIERIRRLSPESAQWGYADGSVCQVVEEDGIVAGFIVTREVGPDEFEILNLAIDPERRRRGLGRRMLADATARPGVHFLEVRESNAGARAFYQAAGFAVAGRRPAYYNEPPEAAIVMKKYS
ncbi:MAG: GNAT family N-acetyltransferase [Bryobacteraceae bacterium]